MFIFATSHHASNLCTPSLHPVLFTSVALGFFHPVGLHCAIYDTYIAYVLYIHVFYSFVHQRRVVLLYFSHVHESVLFLPSTYIGQSHLVARSASSLR
jgi:hypothetical protein